MSTARSRTSGEYLFEELKARSSQVVDSPLNPVQFTPGTVQYMAGEPRCEISGFVRPVETFSRPALLPGRGQQGSAHAGDHGRPARGLPDPWTSSTLSLPTRRTVSPVPRTKNKVLTIRTTAEVKALLKLAAERERGSAASMVEVMVLDYARSHALAVPDSDRSGRKGSNKAKCATKNNDRERPQEYRAVLTHFTGGRRQACRDPEARPHRVAIHAAISRLSRY